MPARKDSESKIPDLAEAVEHTGNVIRTLQARLADVAKPGDQKPGDQAMAESPADMDADLDAELDRYFKLHRGTSMSHLRRRVVEGVVERILSNWDREQGGDSAFENEVIERLIQRMVERFSKDGFSRDKDQAPAAPSRTVAA